MARGIGVVSSEAHPSRTMAADSADDREDRIGRPSRGANRATTTAASTPRQSSQIAAKSAGTRADSKPGSVISQA